MWLAGNKVGLYRIEKVGLFFFSIKEDYVRLKAKKNVGINQWFYDNYKLPRIMTLVTWSLFYIVHCICKYTSFISDSR